MDIFFVTGNQNKVIEINAMLKDTGITVLSQTDLNFHEEIEETGSTFEENAVLKAKTVHDIYRKPVFAEDSGLEIFALNGEPGVLSARYAGELKSDMNNIQLVLNRMKNVDDRRARFRTVVAYLNGKTDITFTGSVYGTITTERRGSGGFGYDSIFKPDGFSHTFAELPGREKNKISHRGIAVRKFVAYLQEEYGLNK